MWEPSCPRSPGVEGPGPRLGLKQTAMRGRVAGQSLCTGPCSSAQLPSAETRTWVWEQPGAGALTVAGPTCAQPMGIQVWATLDRDRPRSGHLSLTQSGLLVGKGRVILLTVSCGRLVTCCAPGHVYFVHKDTGGQQGQRGVQHWGPRTEPCSSPLSQLGHGGSCLLHKARW